MDSFFEMSSGPAVQPNNVTPNTGLTMVDDSVLADNGVLSDNEKPVLTEYDLVQLAHVAANGGAPNGADSIYELTVSPDGSPVLTKDTGANRSYCVVL